MEGCKFAGELSQQEGGPGRAPAERALAHMPAALPPSRMQGDIENVAQMQVCVCVGGWGADGGATCRRRCRRPLLGRAGPTASAIFPHPTPPHPLAPRPDCAV